MNVLVTGASGFFGPEIVTVLRSAGHRTIAASRRAGVGPDALILDVTSPDSCVRAFRAAGPVDVVVHAAAFAHSRRSRDARAWCRLVNVQGTANVVDAAVAAGIRRFIYISSVRVYGDFDLPPEVQELDPCQPHEMYGESKMAAEASCQTRQEFDSVHVLRMATMYSQDWLVNVRKRVQPLTGKRRVYMRLDPSCRRYSLCSCHNGAQVVRWCVEQRLAPGVYNVADRYAYNQQEILQAVEQADGPGWQVSLPLAVPRVLWRLIRVTVPVTRWRTNAHSQYWKYCERNLYSSEKLHRAGFDGPPELLALGRAG